MRMLMLSVGGSSGGDRSRCASAAPPAWAPCASIPARTALASSRSGDRLLVEHPGGLARWDEHLRWPARHRPEFERGARHFESCLPAVAIDTRAVRRGNPAGSGAAPPGASPAQQPAPAAQLAGGVRGCCLAALQDQLFGLGIDGRQCGIRGLCRACLRPRASASDRAACWP